jgi:outer membrane protein assembly factor BamB
MQLGIPARSVVVGPPIGTAWPKGLVYVKARTFVYALDPLYGNVVWSINLGALSNSLGQGAPAVTDYNSAGGGSMYLYVGTSDGYVVKLDAIDGDANGALAGNQEVCRSVKVGTDLSKASPVIGADGVVYFTDDGPINDQLIAVLPNCVLKWALSLGPGPGTSSPVYWDLASPDVADDRIYVGADRLYAVTIWGGPVWFKYLNPTNPAVPPANPVPSTPLLVNVNGTFTLFVVNSLGELYSVPNSGGALTNTGNTLARVGVPITPGPRGAGSLTAIPAGGGQYFIYWAHMNRLYRFNTTDSSVSSVEPFVGASLGDSTPVSDGANLVIGANNGTLYRYNTGLVLQNSTSTGLSSINAGPAIAPNAPNWLFVPSADGFVRAYAAAGNCNACVVEPGSDWPEFQRNRNNEGAGAFTPGGTPALLWNRNLGGDVFPPIVGQNSPGPGGYPQGLSYVVSGRYLKALDLNARSEVWSYDLGILGQPFGFAAPVVTDQVPATTGFANGVVYVGARDSVLHAVDALTGQKVWDTKIGLYDISKASPVIGDDGTIYVVEAAPINRLVAISHEGGIRWGVNIGVAPALSAPAYDGAGDRIFVGGDKLYCFTTAGAACAGWAGGIALGIYPGISGAPLLIGANVYALSFYGSLYSVPLAGGAATPLYTAPLLTGSGSLAYDSNVTGTPHANCSGGCMYWTLGGRLYRHNIGVGTQVFGLTGVTTNSTPVVDSAGNVFVGTSSGLFYVPRDLAGTNAVPNTNVPTGTALRTPFFTSPILGSMAGAGAIFRSPLGGSEGVLLWPSADDNLYAFGKPEAECATCDLALVQWPIYQANAAHAPSALNGGGPAIRESRTYVAVGAPIRAPVVDSTANNRLYFVVGSSLYARDRFSDTNLWTYNLTLPVTVNAFGMPALMQDTNRAANDQIIVLVGGSDGVLHAVRGLNGQPIWKVDVGFDISKASVVTSTGGYIFVVEDKPGLIDQLIALDAKGTVLWRRDIGSALTTGISTPAVNTNNTAGTGDDVVVVGGAAGLYAFNVTNGNTPAGWTASFAPIGLTDGSPVVAAPGGTFDAYYVITQQGELARVITNTNYEILADVPGLGRSGAPYARINGGVTESVFFGVGNTLYQYVMADGVLRSLVLGGDLGDSTPLAGDNALYLGSSDGKFYSVNDLTTLNSIAWASASAIVSMAGPGAFIDNATVVWPSQNGRLRVFENGGGAGTVAVVGQWPFAQGNDARTGTSSAALNTSVAEELMVLGAGDAKPPVIGDVNQPLPAYTQGIAYFTAGTKVYALDLNSRLVVQTWDRGPGNVVLGNAAPAVETSGGLTRVFVVDMNGNVRAYGGDATGWKTAPLWVTDVGLNTSNASPVVRNNLVYVVESAGIVRVHALNITNGSITWTATLGAGTGASSPAFYDSLPDRLFVGADKLYALNANTGSILWTRTLNGPVAAAPLVVDNTGTANDYVMALTTIGGLYRIPVTGGASAPTPVANLVGGVNIATSLAAFSYSAGNHYIFFALGNKLYRYDSATPPPPPPPALPPMPPSITLGISPANFYSSSPIVDNSGNVYIGGGDGLLYGVDGDAVTMAQLTPPYSPIDGTGWPKPVGAGNALSAVNGTLAIDVNNRLYVPSIDDNLRRYALPPGACGGCGLYTAAPWPMFQHDPQHSGRNNQPTAEGHRTPLVLKTFTQTIPIVPPRTAVLGPVTSANPKGVLYYTSGQYLIARDANSGAVLWQYDMGLLGGPSVLSGASPALMLRAANGAGTDDDTVWVLVGGMDGYLTAVNATDGKMVWRLDLGLDISKSSPAIDSLGNIYVLEDAIGSDRLHAVYWNGMRRWTRVLDSVYGSGASSPTLDDTNVYVSSGNKVYAFIALTGAIASGWPTAGTVGGVTIPVGLVNTTTLLKARDAGLPANASDLTDLWVVNNIGGIYRMVASTGALTDGNPGTVLVIDPIYQGVGAVSDGVSPAVQYDPFTKVDIVVYTAGVNMYRVRWTAPDSPNPDALASVSFLATPALLGNTSPVIDENGWSYVLDSLGYLRGMYRYGPAWVFIKKVATQGTSVGGILVANDGTLYVPSRNNSIYVVGKP